MNSKFTAVQTKFPLPCIAKWSK